MKHMKKVSGMLLLFCCAVLNLGITADAAQIIRDEAHITNLECDVILAEAESTTRATGPFDVEIAGNSIAKTDTAFSVEAGEAITIDASYSPKSASVDFGLIAPDGLFHYVNTKTGAIHKTIRVDEQGYYTFAIRNNSSDTVRVLGFVNY